MTLAWATSPYIYWVMYVDEIKGTDDDQTHTNDHSSSLFWWVPALSQGRARLHGS